jgi:rhodanese-related sulfurtransferase
MRTLAPPPFRDLIRQPGVVLLDVRMPDEHAIASLPGAVLIPLPELGTRFSELNPQDPVAIYCHHGVRSEHAGRFLESRGFTDVSHLAGGIDAWSEEIDPTVPRY